MLPRTLCSWELSSNEAGKRHGSCKEQLLGLESSFVREGTHGEQRCHKSHDYQLVCEIRAHIAVQTCKECADTEGEAGYRPEHRYVNVAYGRCEEGI